MRRALAALMPDAEDVTESPPLMLEDIAVDFDAMEQYSEDEVDPLDFVQDDEADHDGYVEEVVPEYVEDNAAPEAVEVPSFCDHADARVLLHRGSFGCFKFTPKQGTEFGGRSGRWGAWQVALRHK